MGIYDLNFEFVTRRSTYSTFIVIDLYNLRALFPTYHKSIIQIYGSRKMVIIFRNQQWLKNGDCQWTFNNNSNTVNSALLTPNKQGIINNPTTAD